MLRLLDNKQEKKAAQAQFVAHLRAAWTKHEERQIVWRPNKRTLLIAHNDDVWFGFVELGDDQTTPRYWNSFGSYSPTGNLQITVEINIPTRLILPALPVSSVSMTRQGRSI
jgi:hypothetical protein